MSLKATSDGKNLAIASKEQEAMRKRHTTMVHDIKEIVLNSSRMGRLIHQRFILIHVLSLIEVRNVENTRKPVNIFLGTVF